MKKIQILLLLLFPSMVFCQQVIPYLKKAKSTITEVQVAEQVFEPGTRVPAGGAIEFVNSNVVLLQNAIIPKNNAARTLTFDSTFMKSGERVLDSAILLKPGIKTLNEGEIVSAKGAVKVVSKKVVSTDPKAKRVVFYASTSLSGETSDLEKSFTASGKLAVAANPIGNFYLGIGANLLNVNPARQKKDSVDFNSLMFPETGNFGVLITPSYRFNLGTDDAGTSNFSLNPFYEFAYRKVAIDSPDLAFKVFNHTIGVGLQWHYMPNPDEEKNELTINLIPYWHLFNIPTEDVKSFTTFVNDTLFQKAALEKKSVNVGSFGIKLTAQYSNFIFFADFRRNLRARNLPDGNPFKGGAVNVGFMTSFKIGSF